MERHLQKCLYTYPLLPFEKMTADIDKRTKTLELMGYWHFIFNVRPADNEAFIKKMGKEWSDTLFEQINKDLFRYSFSYATPDGVYPTIPCALWKNSK